MPARGPLVCLPAFAVNAAAHGWVTSPVSKNEMAYHHYQPGMPDDFRYEPQTSNHGNAMGGMSADGGAPCGAASGAYVDGLGTWRKWYDAASVPVPRFAPGETLDVNITLTIDHGGQAWLLLACADRVSESDAWTVLERSADDRAAHFMPGAPGAFAWAPLEYEGQGDRIRARWTVPAGFTCADGRGVARWVWKTGNSCNDVNNVGRKTEAFSRDEFGAVVHAFKPGAWVQDVCTEAPETFISCLDFEVSAPAPPPPPVADPVGACHDAAKAFCDTRGFCHTCQAWGTWGNMFFAAVCNDDTNTCNEPVAAAGGVSCACQQAGGCAVDGVKCAYVPPSGPSPATPAPARPPPPPAPAPPAPKPANCANIWQQCGGTDWKGATCCQGNCGCVGSDTYKQCKPAQAGQGQC